MNFEQEVALRFAYVNEEGARGGAKTPCKGTEGAAGYDLCSAINTVVPAKGKQLVPTGLTFEIPPNTYGRIAPRSGLAWKNFIDVGAGVIDSDYRGEVKVLLFNHSDTDFEIKEGDRISQLIIERIAPTKLQKVESLSDSTRGGKGFGSTGVATTNNTKA